MRRRFCALSIMTLVAVYLFAGGLAYHAMDDPHRSLANRYDASSRSVMMMVDALAAGQIMPEKTIRPDKRVILFNYYFQKSIAGPVLIGGIAFWIWLNAHRRLTSYVPRRPSRKEDSSSSLCPECGAGIRHVPEETPATTAGASSDWSDAALMKSRGIGGVVLLVSIGFLLLGGIFRLALPTIVEVFGTPRLSSPAINGMTEDTPIEFVVELMQISNPDVRYADVAFTYRLVQIDRMFRSCVFLAVVAAAMGFALWYLAGRRVFKTADRCPFCKYDLPEFAARVHDDGKANKAETASCFGHRFDQAPE